MKRRWGMRTVSVVFFVSARLRQNCALGLAGRRVFFVFAFFFVFPFASRNLAHAKRRILDVTGMLIVAPLLCAAA